MSTLSVEPISTRIWENEFDRWELVVERDKNRKKSQQQVDERIHYLWFHYLKLCLNLEGIKHSIEKKGRGGKVISKTKVKVSKTIYKKWDLNELSNRFGTQTTMTFGEWYKDEKHRLLFTKGGFKFSRGSQYHSLVKRYNVFIEYYNKMNTDYGDDGDGGRMTKKMKICEDIVEKFQKERYDQIKRKENKQKSSSLQTIVLNDINDCEKTILSVCKGQFPKSLPT
jgi:hypothetical protein